MPLGNLGTNLKELHTPKSTLKKPKWDGGDKKEKLELDKVLYENKVQQEANSVLGTLKTETIVCWENRRKTGHLASIAM